MSTVTAYAATSGHRAADQDHHHPARRRPARCAVRHPLRRDLPSDIHTVRAEWGQPRYPVVPGHEIAGVVTEVGSQVTKHKVGDRVGVGCFVDSCRECDHCLAGLEQYCTGGGNIGTYNAIGRDGQPTYGGYSGSIVVDENYVLRIPDALGLHAAAPLAVRGHHHLLAAAALECRAGQADRRRGPRRSGPWRSSSPRRWAPR